MTTIVTRAGKGSALTHNEVDSNFTNLNSAKYESGNNATLGTIQGSTITATTAFSGALNGTVGATTPAAGTFTSLSDSGNLTFTGTGNRITGDFSNATLANRVWFRDATTNNSSTIGVLPNGTSAVTSIIAFGGSDPDNAPRIQLRVDGTSQAQLRSEKSGTGTVLPMGFIIDSIERMRIDTSGNVGIGRTSTGSRLEVAGRIACSFANVTNADAGIDLVDSASTGGNTLRWIDSAGYVANLTQYSTSHATLAGVMTVNNGGGYRWNVNGGERMRIDSSGNVGIGTTSPSTILQVAKDSTVATISGFRTGTYTGTEIAANLVFGYGTDSLTSVNCVRDGSDSAAALTFGTQPNAGAVTERMRIDSSGNVLVNDTTDLGNGKLMVTGIVDNRVAIQTYQNSTTTQGAIWFKNPNGNVGTINTSGSSTSYNTSSDYRLKENVAPMIGALETVAQLKPVTYNWKADGSDGQGFIAHELQAVVPDAVTGEKDAVDKDGKPVYQGIDTSFLVATLTAAIQELNAKVTALEAQLQGN